MAKYKKALVLIIVCVILINQWIPTSIVVKASEAEEENTTFSMAIDEWKDILGDEIDDGLLEEIAQLYLDDEVAGITTLSLFECYRLAKDANEENETQDNPSNDSLGEIMFQSAINTGTSEIIDFIKDQNEERAKIKFSNAAKEEFGQDLIDYLTEKNGGVFDKDYYDRLLIVDGKKEKKDDYIGLVEKGEATFDLIVAAAEDDPDKWLKVYLKGGDLLSEFLGDDAGSSVSGAIWDFNANLWEDLMATEEYQEFVQKNNTTEKFHKAFWECTWEGLVDCMSDLPRELAMIGDKLFGLGEKAVYNSVQDFQSYTRELAGGGNYATWMMKKIRGELKPTTQVNVYKPNIYLYADNEMKVTVDFMQEELLTVTIPQYINEWNATVHGDGSLTCDGTEYDFLFYESKAFRELVTKESGWVITAENREAAMLEILGQYQFNEEETTDFMEFWMDKLEPGVNYMMYPQVTKYVDAQMPVEITPMADSITRLWFGFEEYRGQNVEIPIVEPITREGFTVVEWGGFLLDE